MFGCESRVLDFVVAKPAVCFFCFCFSIFSYFSFSDWGRLLTFIPKYRKSSIGVRSFECFDWSESLGWHRTSPFITWPMLIDRHLRSMIHRFLQWFFMCGPINNIIFAMTLPTKAKPFLGFENLTRLQISENYKTYPFDELYNLDINQL